MSNPSADDAQPLDPAAARMVAKVRWLMLISGVTTMVAIAAVIGVIGYRVFKAEGSATTAVDVTALLPKGARIVATAVAEDRVAVTIDVGGAIEIRTFDLRTFKPTGRLRFATEP
jgi:3D (Asp-Asp-Asp) domain-containing protein